MLIGVATGVAQQFGNRSALACLCPVARRLGLPEVHGEDRNDHGGQRKPTAIAPSARATAWRCSISPASAVSDLILMDIQLPEVSGLEVTKWLKEETELQTIPVVAVTAFAMRGD